MNQIKLFALIFLFCYSEAIYRPVSYNGYRLVRLYPSTEVHYELLAQWEQNPEFDVWGQLRGANQTTTVLLSPYLYQKYKPILDSNRFNFEIIENNIQARFDEQDESNSRADLSVLSKYNRINDINNFMLDLANENNFVNTYVAGKSYEGRDMRVITIGTGTRHVWIDCGIHAREWISPATCVYMMNKFITEYKANNAITLRLLGKYTFHILPVHNPDGYEYSHTTNRNWRKNRRPNSGSSCVGTDLNRNFGFQWFTGGSSSNTCDDTYAGPSANSEAEVKAVQSAINSRLGLWDAFFTIHSYGLWWFTIWGYTRTLPSTYTDLMNRAKAGVDAFTAVNRLGLTYGSSSNILYIASGGSEDWATGTAGIRYAYCLELRPGQTGTDSSFGFALPADRITPAGEETYAGIKAFMNQF